MKSKIVPVLFLIGLMLSALPISNAAAQVNAPFPYMATALTATVVQPKLSPGTFQWGSCYNPNASVEYVNIFDLATAVTMGATTPKVAVPMAASGVTQLPFPFVFLKGLQIAATTTAGGATAPGSALVCNFGFN